MSGHLSNVVHYQHLAFFPAHSSIVAACSIYMRSALTNISKQDYGTVFIVQIPNIQTVILENILNFIYLGRLQNTGIQNMPLKTCQINSAATCEMDYWLVRYPMQFLSLSKSYPSFDLPLQSSTCICIEPNRTR